MRVFALLAAAAALQVVSASPYWVDTHANSNKGNPYWNGAWNNQNNQNNQNNKNAVPAVTPCKPSIAPKSPATGGNGGWGGYPLTFNPSGWGGYAPGKLVPANIATRQPNAAPFTFPPPNAQQTTAPSKTPKAPKPTKTPKAPKPTKTPKAPKPTKTPKAPKPTKTPKPSNAAQTGDNSDDNDEEPATVTPAPALTQPPSAPPTNETVAPVEEQPTPEPTLATLAPTPVATTAAPSPEPTTVAPTSAPSTEPPASTPPTETPTETPTAAPTVAPTATPTEAPTEVPTEIPTEAPTAAPAAAASPAPAPAPASTQPASNWPTASEVVQFATPKVIAAGEVFDGGMKTYERSDVTCDEAKAIESGDAVFIINPGGVLKNAIIGGKHVLGVFCSDNKCALENVWWDDVCQAALVIATGLGSTTVTGGGAKAAAARVILAQTGGSVTVSGDFYMEGCAELFESCSTCGPVKRQVTVDGVVSVNPTAELVRVNKNYKDEATISKAKIVTNTTDYKVCTHYDGGKEPILVGSGVDGTLCTYTTTGVTIVSP